MLRSTIKVEPPATDWVRIDSRFTGKTFVTSEQSEISVEVQIPESVSSTLRAFVLVESNGGSRRVEIRVEPVLKSNATPEAPTPEPLAIASGLSERLASVTVGTRIVTFALGAAGVRTVLLAGDWLATRFGSDGSSSPSLGGSALVFGTILGLAAVRSALRRGEGREAFPAGFAGAFGGALFATLAVAACRSIEPVFGTTLSNSALFACGLWLFLGGWVGWLSAQVLPHEQTIPGGEGAAS